MAVLSWGLPKIEYTESTDGAPSDSATWTTLDTPKEDTTKLTATAGTEVTATEEGGAIVDVRYGATTYEFELQLFVKKGVSRPFTDTDGVIDGEWAWRVVPNDTECEGIQIDRSVVRCEESYSTADGILLRYVSRALKPASGNTVKSYTEG